MGHKKIVKTFLFTSILAISLVSCISCEKRSDSKTIFQMFDLYTNIKATAFWDLEKYGIYSVMDLYEENGEFLVMQSGTNELVSLIDTSDNKAITIVRKGRGPGEFITPSSFDVNDRQFQLFDISRQVLQKYSLDEILKNREAVPDTLIQFESSETVDSRLSRPFIIKSAGDYYVATGFFEDDYWYAMVNKHGSVQSGIPFVQFKETLDLGSLQKATYHLSSSLGISDDGKHVVCATIQGGAVSFSEIKDSIICEKTRLAFFPPLIKQQKEKDKPLVEYLPSSKHVFMDIQIVESLVYILYSGKKIISNDLPSWECSHLLVFNLDGSAQRRYELKESINSFFIDGNILYGTSTYPQCRILKFEL